MGRNQKVSFGVRNGNQADIRSWKIEPVAHMAKTRHNDRLIA
jgi:hypothetical protein